MMKKGRMYLFATMTVLALTLSACGGKEPAATTTGVSATSAPSASASGSTSASASPSASPSPSTSASAQPTSAASAATATATAAATTAAAKDAESLYKANCMGCHGANLEGKAAPELAKVGSRMTKDEIVNQILKGGGRMPAQDKKVSAEEAETLAVWLASKK